MMKGRIAYLCLEAPEEGRASYTHVHEIIKGLQHRGWEVELFSPWYGNKGTPPSLLNKCWKFISVQFRIWKRSRTINVLYVRGHPAALPIVVWCKIYGIPVVLEVNGPYGDLFLAYPWTTSFKPLFRALMWAPMKIANALIVVTFQLKSWAEKELGQKPIFVIHNGANTTLFCPGAHLKYPMPKPYVVFVGVLARWQGIETLMQAVKRPEWPKEVNLVVVGDGVEKPLVQAEIGHNKRIFYLGRIPYKDVPGVMVHSIASLCPKNDRGGRSNTGLSPLKVYETLACGVPVVVTDFPGQSDLVRGNNCGLVIAPENPAALAQAVAYLFYHPEKSKEMGRKGRELVEREHSWAKRAEETEKVIEKVIRKMS